MSDFKKLMLLQILKAVAVSPNKNTGICDNVRFKTFEIYHNYTLDEELGAELDRLMALWPKFSGSVVFPVVHPTEPSPVKAYDLAKVCGELWSGEYGELRKELLQFCIDTLTKELENEEPTS